MDQYYHLINQNEGHNKEWLICKAPIDGEVIVWYGKIGSRLRKVAGA